MLDFISKKSSVIIKMKKLVLLVAGCGIGLASLSSAEEHLNYDVYNVASQVKSRPDSVERSGLFNETVKYHKSMGESRWTYTDGAMFGTGHNDTIDVSDHITLKVGDATARDYELDGEPDFSGNIPNVDYSIEQALFELQANQVGKGNLYKTEEGIEIVRRINLLKKSWKDEERKIREWYMKHVVNDFE